MFDDMRRDLQSYTDDVSVFAWAENVFQMGGGSSENRADCSKKETTLQQELSLLNYYNVYRLLT